MKRTIIITDDKNIGSQVYQNAFEGIRPFLMDYFEFSLDSIIRKNPEVIIIDIDSKEKLNKISSLLKSDFSTAYIPVITFLNKSDLTSGIINFLHGCDDYLLRPIDSTELNLRMGLAIKRSKHSFYANPLTGLPGGIVIEETLKRRLEDGESFVVGHVDIDNFKSFNDRYGYLKGDRVIMQTAYMLNMAIKTWGDKDDFLGHIGGDDFVVTTTPEKYNELFRNFVCMFDTIIPFHYSNYDRENGFIKIKDRMKILREIPLMSITVAMVLKNSSYELSSLIEINDRIAEVKQYLKKIPGSKYMADRRMIKKDDSLLLQVFNNDEKVLSKYRPLGQLLLEKNIITPDELDKALKEHWKRGVLLGGILKEMKFITDEDLDSALEVQVEELRV